MPPRPGACKVSGDSFELGGVTFRLVAYLSEIEEAKTLLKQGQSIPVEPVRRMG